jgi:hypothetical protein
MIYFPKTAKPDLYLRVNQYVKERVVCALLYRKRFVERRRARFLKQ